MKRNVLFIVISCLFLMVMKESSIHAITWAIIQGTVKTEDGKPIEGAQIILLYEDGTKYELTTDNKGKWIKANIIPGDYIIDIKYAGYMSASLKTSLSSLRQNAPINVKLSPILKSPIEKADELYQNKKYQDALQEYQKIMAQNQESSARSALYQKIGLCHYQLNDLDNAIKYFKLTIEKTPNSQVALLNLCSISAEKGDFQEAMNYLQMLKEENLTNPDLFYNLGILSFKNAQTDSAIEFFKKCLIKDPSYFKAYYQLGLVYVNKGEMEEAKKNFQKVIELKPESEEATLAKSLIESM